MYNSQTTKKRIKELCKSNGINEETLLANCGLGINAIRQINDNKGMSSYSLARIADQLNCSVDYLLGRTDIKETPAEAEAKIKTIIDLYNKLSQENKNLLSSLLQTMLEQQEANM